MIQFLNEYFVSEFIQSHSPAHFIGLIIYLFFVQDYEVSSTLLTKTKVDSTKQIMKYVKRLNKDHRTLRKEKKGKK